MNKRICGVCLYQTLYIIYNPSTQQMKRLFDMNKKNLQSMHVSYVEQNMAKRTKTNFSDNKGRCGVFIYEKVTHR